METEQLYHYILQLNYLDIQEYSSLYFSNPARRSTEYQKGFTGTFDNKFLLHMGTKGKRYYVRCLQEIQS